MRNDRYLAIDTPTGRVRVYKRGPYGGFRILDEVQIVTPQHEELTEQLESLRAGRPMTFATLPEQVPA